jgi:glycosyltransferase involved in cell wall biosynthesis
MKKVLLISFDYPPRRTSAVYRVACFTKYLVRLGWETTVLTVKTLPGDVEDPELMTKLPATLTIVRTPYLNFRSWEQPAARAVRSAGVLRSPASAHSQPLLDQFLRDAGDFVQSYLYFPDKTVGWIPYGVLSAVQLQMERRFDLVYSTSPPKTGPIVAYWLKRLLKVPWVAEFRDPWYPHRRPLRRRMEQLLKAELLRNADSVVVISKGNAEDLQGSYGVSADKLTVISNGYDEDDFTGLPESVNGYFPSGYVHLSHFGTVYPRFSGCFFEALLELVREQPDVRNRLRVNIIGFPDEVVERFANEPELKDVIQLQGFIQHSEALRAMRASDCLLLFLGHREVGRLSGLGKVYEYLRVGRPILAVAYESGTKELIEQANAGWVVDPENKPAMKDAFGTILRGVEQRIPLPVARPEFAEQFRYDRLARQLADVLNRVAREKAEG